jgi:hypothetical protein
MKVESIKVKDTESKGLIVTDLLSENEEEEETDDDSTDEDVACCDNGTITEIFKMDSCFDEIQLSVTYKGKTYSGALTEGELS